jgi:hypothetical protein
MKIDELVEHFKTLEPKQTESFETIYQKAWDPAKYQKQEE